MGAYRAHRRDIIVAKNSSYDVRPTRYADCLSLSLCRPRPFQRLGLAEQPRKHLRSELGQLLPSPPPSPVMSEKSERTERSSPESTSPASVSPGTITPTAQTGYFPLTSPASHTDPRLASIPEHVKGGGDDVVSEVQTRSRPGSVSSITFKLDPLGPAIVAGRPKEHPPARLRQSSPPAPGRFEPHVSFDNFAGGEPTESNAISFTLNVKHTGYQYKKRSRTFMVGIDENEYSETALRWMLAELVDDGDEIVCVRVVDPDAKISSYKSMERKQYQDEAQHIMQKIQERNDDHRAISIVLEFAVGKLHTTFQKMIQLYEPAMLIVGTKGRSLGGLQGLMGNRNSFSKWCLQYSPIPVVVVRPDEKRQKKRNKRALDPTRHNYKAILENSGIEVHESKAKPGGSFERVGILPAISQDQEAHAVATALGLPAAFDPTIKLLDALGGASLRNVDSRRSDATTATTTSRESISPDSRPSSPRQVDERATIRIQTPMCSDEEDGDSSEDEGEFEATMMSSNNGPDSVEKKERLYLMEVDEARALADRKASISSSASGEGGADLDDDE